MKRLIMTVIPTIKKMPDVFLLVVLLLSLTACGKSTEAKWQEQYDLGIQYLEEGDYEAAIVAFTAAIEIDAKEMAAYTGRGNAYILSGETDENLALALADYEMVLVLMDEELSSAQGELSEEQTEILVEAYLGIADVYIRQGDYDSALEILREGLEKTNNSEEISQKIEEIETGNITDSSGNTRRLRCYDEAGELIWYHEYTYHADGKMASVTSYDGSGNQTGHVDLLYDENGNSLVTYSYDVDDGTLASQEREYDESGNCIRAVITYADEIFVYTYEYNAQGNQTGWSQYNGDGELIVTAVYELNDQGLMIRETRYDPDGNLDDYFIYEYNDDRQMTMFRWYLSDGTLFSTEVYLYDSEGNYIGYEEYDGDGNLMQYGGY